MKRIVALLLVFALTACFFAACGDDSPMEAAEAVDYVCKELGAKESELSDIHVHPGNLDTAVVWNVSFSYKGESFTYSVDVYSGEILNIEEGAHSH